MEKISIIVPTYNEEDIIEDFYIETNHVLKQLDNYSYEIIFINDGSKDKTLEILKRLKGIDDNIKIINFSRNFGKESSIYAGLENSSGDFTVIIDADLQHPPKKIIEMMEGIEERI